MMLFIGCVQGNRKMSVFGLKIQKLLSTAKYSNEFMERCFPVVKKALEDDSYASELTWGKYVIVSNPLVAVHWLHANMFCHLDQLHIEATPV